MISLNNKVKVAVCGDFQGGKSTLINCLLDDKYCPTGKGGGGLRTTPCSTIFLYDEVEVAERYCGEELCNIFDRREDVFEPEKFSPGVNDWVKITCWKPLLENINLVDTPGFDANHEDDIKAEEAINESDYVVFLHSTGSTLNQKSIEKLKKITDSGKKFFFIYNCFRKGGILSWDPKNQNNKNKYNELLSQLDNLGLSEYIIPINGEKIFPCNPIFAWYAMGHLQRDLDSRDSQVVNDAKDYVDQIQEFWNKKFGGNKPISKKDLLELSGVVEIRKAVVQTNILYIFKCKFDDFIKANTAYSYLISHYNSSQPYQTRDGGWRQDFGGDDCGLTLTSRPYDTNVVEVHGAIRNCWINAGAERGNYGWPTSDELIVEVAKVQDAKLVKSSNFENGIIAWIDWPENRIIGTFDRY